MSEPISDIFFKANAGESVIDCRSVATVRRYFFLISVALIAFFVDGELRADAVEKLLSSAGGVSGFAAMEAPECTLSGSFNARRPLVPASIQKIVTTGAVLQLLGPEYRAGTAVYRGATKGASAEIIYVRGGGDPTLNVENLWLLAREIRKRGVRNIEALHLDSSAFGEVRGRVGSRAYEAGASALAFNYNSIGISICPGPVGKPAIVTSDPSEAGFALRNEVMTTAKGGAISINESEIRGSYGFHVRGAIRQGSECQLWYRSVADPGRVAGDTLKGFLTQLGVHVAKVEHSARVPESAQLLFEFFSKPMRFILDDLNHFSTNFIAAQLVYQLGIEPLPLRRLAEPKDRSYSHALGIERMRRYLADQGISADEAQFVDGSGLSHDNRLSANAIATALCRQLADERFAAEVESSLAVAGRSGTLKRRNFAPSAVTLRGKTGSLRGVSSLAGVLVSRSGKRIVFALIQNQIASKDRAERIEEKVVQILAGW